ncbi:hypothetical protein DFJ73DRAFT_757254 [Zopfochytrium polystomum]|nr:hypothetical protein DFJ73DRAFT_757254 [Zopfochytrium polystomum]
MMMLAMQRVPSSASTNAAHRAHHTGHSSRRLVSAAIGALALALAALVLFGAVAAGAPDSAAAADAAAALDRAISAANAVSRSFLSSGSSSSSSAASPPNPDGSIVHLTDKSFPTLTASAPWLVMFHAPWCGHCKHLSPVVEEFSKTVKGKLNVGKVNCDAEVQTAKKFGIRGYPTLKYVQDPFPSVDFKGQRSVEGLTQFTKTFLRPPFKVVRASEIPSIVERNDASAFFVYDHETTSNEDLRSFAAVAASLRADLPVYVTPDPESFTFFKLDRSKSPAVVVAKDAGTEVLAYHGAALTDLASPSSQLDLRSWIVDNKHALVPMLDAHNLGEVMSNDNVIAVAVLDASASSSSSSSSSEGVRDDVAVALPVLRQAAKAWNQRWAADTAASAASKRNPVRFAWLDAADKLEYVTRVYGIKREDLPRIVIAQPKEELFYDVGVDGKLLAFDVERLLAGVDAVLRGKLSGKSVHGYFGGLFVKFNRYMTPFVVRIPQN